MLPHLEAAGRPGPDASGPQSIVRLPNLGAPRPAAAAASATLVPQSAKTSTQAVSQPLRQSDEPATAQERTPNVTPSLVGEWLKRIPLSVVADRAKTIHAFVMRPKIWLACVACLSLVALVTLVPRKAEKSAATNSNQAAGERSASSVRKPPTAAPAPIVVPVPVPKSESELVPSTALDSRGSSPALRPQADVPHVAERAEVARFDGVADDDAQRADPLGATLGEIEPVRESGPAAPEGASRP
jgi:hypothetical protein